MSKVLSQVASAWADLLGAEACAIGLTDPDLPADLHWVAGGTGGAPAGLDSIARETLATGVPVTYVRHEGLEGERDVAPLKQAIAAFPLESWPAWSGSGTLAYPARSRRALQVLRRAARDLGGWALRTRVVSLERERDDLR